jgi:ParB family chromosome partitioning protein
LQRLIDEFGLTHQQAADAVGRSRPAASNLLRLLQLTAPVQEMLISGRLDMGHARALLPVAGGQQLALAQRIVQKQLSVRETERLVQQLLNPPKKSPEKIVDQDLLRLQEELSDGLGASVAIRANKKGVGKVTIEFSSLDQLDGLLFRLRV